MEEAYEKYANKLKALYKSAFKFFPLLANP